MTRISALPETKTLNSGDNFVLDGGSGTKRLSVGNAFSLLSGMFGNNAGLHNSFFRGKNLGTTFTTAQQNAISSGNFDDLFVGDYWTLNGINWRIADFDYWLGVGATSATTCSSHHVVIVPDTSPVQARMNPTATNAGGYLAAQGRNQLSTIRRTVSSLFGDSHILPIDRPFTSGAQVGHATAMSSASVRLELMSERMVYGSPVFELQNALGNNDNNVKFAWNHTADLSQLSLFRVAPQYKSDVPAGQYQSTGYWLNNMAKYDHFCCYRFGRADCLPANSSLGIRPVMAIG